MPQLRFFIRAARVEAERIFGTLEKSFEGEWMPLAIAEIDEARELFEVSLYVDAAEAAGIRSRFAQGAGLADEEVEAEELPDKDWMADVLKGLRPVRAGRFLVHGAHDRDKVKANDLSIEIEAGEAFGTGHHGTTAGCLEMIERLLVRRRPRAVLDVGTGSAVLAIAIAKFARRPVMATDIDPIAVRVAQMNAAANGVGGLVTVREAVGFAESEVGRWAPYDLIVANILAGPLMRMAPDFADHLSPDGDLVLSGILARQRWAVLASFRNVGLIHRRTLWREGWVTLHLTR